MGTSIENRQLDQLASSIASLCSGKYSDFTIRCTDGTIIRAHRAVVCPRSRVLAAAIDGEFQEAISKEIYLEDDEPSIVVKMIDFLYKLDYDDHRAAPTIHKVDFNFDLAAEVSSDTDFSFGDAVDGTLHQTDDQDQTVDEDQLKWLNPLSLLINAKVYVIADKYEIQALKDLASAKYKHVLPDTWNSSAFTESADVVYNNTVETDRILRDEIVQKASENVKMLLDRGEFVDLLKSQGDLAVEVLRKVVGNPDMLTQGEAIDLPWAFSARLKNKKKKAKFSSYYED